MRNMPVPRNESISLDGAYLLAKAVKETCAALHIADEDKDARAAVAARLADLVREGLKNPEALRDRVVREAQAKI